MKRVFVPFLFLLAMTFLGTVPALGQQQNIIIPMTRVTPEERARIENCVPDKPIVPPKQKRKLLLFDVQGKYIGHSSIPYMNYAMQVYARKTGAFEVTLSRNTDDFLWENLCQYDAVFFNNVVGTPFVDEQLKENLLRFIREGGGFIGVHGTTAAFLMIGEGGTDTFPEFGNMIGGRGAWHRSKTEQIYVRVEEPDHPLTKMFPAEGFNWTDEIFRYPTIYSRKNLRVLLSIDIARSEMKNDPPGKRERKDDDYGLAWIRPYGKGRVFYCDMAHQLKTFFDPVMLKFNFAGVQYALGDLDAPDAPDVPR